jgi:RNA polymerase sigma factor (sigma-70 family)
MTSNTYPIDAVLSPASELAGISNALWSACQRETNRVLEQRDWRLVPLVEEFIKQVAGELGTQAQAAGQAVNFQELVRLSVFRNYSSILYVACGERGTTRQHRAFEEVWAYIYPIGLNRLHQLDRAQECAQRALVKIWQKLDQCRDGRSFLHWAAVTAINEYRDLMRSEFQRSDTAVTDAVGQPQLWVRRLEVESDSKPRDDQSEQSGLERMDGQARDRAPRLDDAGTRSRLVQAIRHCLASSLAQQTVIVELFLNEWGVKETADRLSTSIGNVYVLKTRALQALRNCERFISVLEDWLDLEASHLRG